MPVSANIDKLIRRLFNRPPPPNPSFTDETISRAPDIDQRRERLFSFPTPNDHASPSNATPSPQTVQKLRRRYSTAQSASASDTETGILTPYSVFASEAGRETGKSTPNTEIERSVIKNSCSPTNEEDIHQTPSGSLLSVTERKRQLLTPNSSSKSNNDSHSHPPITTSAKLVIPEQFREHATISPVIERPSSPQLLSVVQSRWHDTDEDLPLAPTSPDVMHCCLVGEDEELCKRFSGISLKENVPEQERVTVLAMLADRYSMSSGNRLSAGSRVSAGSAMAVVVNEEVVGELPQAVDDGEDQVGSDIPVAAIPTQRRNSDPGHALPRRHSLQATIDAAKIADLQQALNTANKTITHLQTTRTTDLQTITSLQKDLVAAGMQTTSLQARLNALQAEKHLVETRAASDAQTSLTTTTALKERNEKLRECNARLHMETRQKEANIRSDVRKIVQQEAKLEKAHNSTQLLKRDLTASRHETTTYHNLLVKERLCTKSTQRELRELRWEVRGLEGQKAVLRCVVAALRLYSGGLGLRRSGVPERVRVLVREMKGVGVFLGERRGVEVERRELGVRLREAEERLRVLGEGEGNGDGGDGVLERIEEEEGAEEVGVE